MGTIKQGIWGGFSGKVGTVIGASWKGISYMRGRAQHVHNPKTEGQMTQRSKFALVLELLKPITAYVRIGFKTYAKQQTAFNAAMAYNVKNAFSGTYPNFVFEPSQALVSRGSLTQAKSASATAAVGGVQFSWADNSGEGSAQSTDVAMPLVFNPVRNEAVFNTSAASRADTTITLAVPADWSGESCICFLGFQSADGNEIATSLYLGAVTIS